MGYFGFRHSDFDIVRNDSYTHFILKFTDVMKAVYRLTDGGSLRLRGFPVQTEGYSI